MTITRPLIDLFQELHVLNSRAQSSVFKRLQLARQIINHSEFNPKEDKEKLDDLLGSLGHAIISDDVLPLLEMYPRKGHWIEGNLRDMIRNFRVETAARNRPKPKPPQAINAPASSNMDAPGDEANGNGSHSPRPPRRRHRELSTMVTKLEEVNAEKQDMIMELRQKLIAVEDDYRQQLREKDERIIHLERRLQQAEKELRKYHQTR